MLDESRGTALLKERFEQAGYKIWSNYPWQAEGVSAQLDGFDPDALVGYEFITTSAGDRAEITAAVVDTLERLAEEGRVYVLLVDEVEAPDEETLGEAAGRFLAEVARRRAG
ncbi:MAG: hypothetical protein AB1758_34185 [Candidatus Eremiobacterota bacterium]